MSNHAQRTFGISLIVAASGVATISASAIDPAAMLLVEAATTERIWDVDTATPDALNSRNWSSGAGGTAAAEYGFGALYMSTSDVFISVVEPITGNFINDISISLPPQGNRLTSFEFVGTTMYAGLSTSAGFSIPSYLVRVNLDTGIVTLIGALGFNGGTGGLAFDGSTLYTVNSSGANATLYTVDTATGAATPVGPVLNELSAPVKLTGLEFGADSVLYGLSNDVSGNILYTIDPTTGAATTLGSMPSFPGGAVAITSFVNFQPTGSTCATDLNNDGTTGGADLGLLLGAWGSCP